MKPVAPKGSRAALEAFLLIGQLGLVMILSVLLPLGLGILLDRWTGMGAFKIVFLLLGVVAAYWNAARLLRRYWRESG